jgi:hypothetical protein
MREMIGLSTLLGLALLGPAGCREQGRPDPEVQMAVSHEPETTSQSEAQGSDAGGGMQGGQGQVAVPTRLEVPDAVKQAYSGVILLWKDSSNGKDGKLEVPFGSSVEIPGSGLTVSADAFLPAFTMTADTITSSGVAEENPAARIRVSEKGKDLFGGWIFKRFPDVHPFTHSRFTLRLDGGIHKPGK